MSDPSEAVPEPTAADMRHDLPMLYRWYGEDTTFEQERAILRRCLAAEKSLDRVKRAFVHAANFVGHHDRTAAEFDWANPLLGNEVSGPVAELRRSISALEAQLAAAVRTVAGELQPHSGVPVVPPPTHATGLWRRLRDSLDGCEANGPDADEARANALDLREWLIAGGDFPHGLIDPYVDFDRRSFIAYLTGVIEYRGAVRTVAPE